MAKAKAVLDYMGEIAMPNAAQGYPLSTGAKDGNASGLGGRFSESPEMRKMFKATRNLMEIRILDALLECPNDSQVRIAERACLTLSVTHYHLHRMSAAGWIAFDGPSDKKLQYLVTEMGRARLAELGAAFFGATVECASRAREQIRLVVEKALQEGFTALVVVGPLVSLGIVKELSPSGVQSVEYKAKTLELAVRNGDDISRHAVLVLDDYLKEDVAIAIDNADSLGIPCFQVGRMDKTAGRVPSS